MHVLKPVKICSALTSENFPAQIYPRALQLFWLGKIPGFKVRQESAASEAPMNTPQPVPTLMIEGQGVDGCQLGHVTKPVALGAGPFFDLIFISKMAAAASGADPISAQVWCLIAPRPLVIKCPDYYPAPQPSSCVGIILRFYQNPRATSLYWVC